MPIAPLALRQCSLFAQAPQDVVESLGEQMEMVHLRKREVWMAHQPAARGLGVVLAGRMQALDQTLDGKEISLITVDSGAVFGHIEWLAPAPTPLNWVAQASSTVAWLPEERSSQLAESPLLCLQLARYLAQQLSDHLAWQKLLAVTPIGARVCAWLLWQDERATTAPTHAELAWRLNTTRESITRTLQRMQTDGWIARDGEHWRIADRAVLLRATQGA